MVGVKLGVIVEVGVKLGVIVVVGVMLAVIDDDIVCDSDTGVSEELGVFVKLTCVLEAEGELEEDGVTVPDGVPVRNGNCESTISAEGSNRMPVIAPESIAPYAISWHVPVATPVGFHHMPRHPDRDAHTATQCCAVSVGN